MSILDAYASGKAAFAREGYVVGDPATLGASVHGEYDIVLHRPKPATSKGAHKRSNSEDFILTHSNHAPSMLSPRRGPAETTISPKRGPAEIAPSRRRSSLPSGTLHHRGGMAPGSTPAYLAR